MTAAALAAGYADFAALLGAAVPGARLHEEPGLAWIDTGLHDDTFNYVYGSSLSEDDFERGVGRVAEHFRRRGLPFRWTVGLRGEPDGFGKVLERHGLRLYEQEPGMLLEPGAAAAEPVPGLKIRPVTDPGLLRRWMWAWGCGAPDDVIESWYRVYAALPYGPDGALRMFVGSLDGEPAATVYLHVVADVGTVHYVVTRPEFRRRGIGAVMTQAAVREAEAAGCRAVVLTASPQGVGVYRRLGFREHCQADTYVWSPVSDSGEVSA